MSKSPLLRSTTSSVAEIRTSTSAYLSWNRCRRNTSHLAAKEGDAVTVNDPVSLCARKRLTEDWIPENACDSPGNSTCADAVSAIDRLRR